jgi:hypothetical protein
VITSYTEISCGIKRLVYESSTFRDVFNELLEQKERKHMKHVMIHENTWSVLSFDLVSLRCNTLGQLNDWRS